MVDTTTSCATCAQYLHTLPPSYDEKSEKTQTETQTETKERSLDCCGRVICRRCIQGNARFGSYCPFCQISTTPTSLPQGLRDPPSYTAPSPSTSPTPNTHPLSPPPYTPSSHQPTQEKPPIPQTEDTLHFLHHPHDTLLSLSLSYKVPLAALRRANNLTSDHLLSARRTILIPGEYYKGGVSLSPRPVEGEEEERRKASVRRWMVACKVSEYDVALLYLQQADYDLDAAVLAYKDDEKWEKEHPIQGSITAKGKTKYDLGRRRFTGQRS